MSAFQLEDLSDPAFRFAPRSDEDWQQYNLALFQKLQAALSNLTAEGSLMTTAALPASLFTGVSGIPDIIALSATDAGSDATVNVAAFSIQIPDRPAISYSSGSITGLAYDTTYYVYTDDPDGTGVSNYVATTNVQDLAAVNGRVRVGAVRTPASGQPDTTGGGGGSTGTGTGEDPNNSGVYP